MDTQWKKVKRITLGSVQTLEELTTRMEDLRDVEAILSQTVSTNLESVMLTAGYGLCIDWVPMYVLYSISLLGY
jgi:hypothetical protein